ncbi:MAG: hypothetical protein EBR30_28605 [Cytophagia bacterium]|nr:hypothetical protein [Cytophagia bacterium]
MKKILALTLILVTFAGFNGFAQEEEVVPPDPAAREKINAARVAYITERLALTPAEAEKFWPLYREFTEKQRVLKHQFNQAKKEGKPANELLDLEYKLKQQNLDLEKEYSGKIRQTISPEKLMGLRRAEEDFRKLVLQQVQQRQMQQQRRELQRDRVQQRQQQRNN